MASRKPSREISAEIFDNIQIHHHCSHNVFYRNRGNLTSFDHQLLEFDLIMSQIKNLELVVSLSWIWIWTKIPGKELDSLGFRDFVRQVIFI